jgi:hypothetical protein
LRQRDRTAEPLPEVGQPVTVSRWSRAATGFTGAAAVAVAIGVAVPHFAGGPAEQPLITLFAFVAMASLWNLLAGFSGLTSFGQHAYLGLGAYALYLVASHGVNPFAGIILAATIASVISLPVSVLVLRLSGGYFAVATLWPGCTCWCGGRSGWMPGPWAAIPSPPRAPGFGWDGSGGWPTWRRRAGPARWGR